MNTKTYLAVGELVQAAAHQHGIVGPVPFTVCHPQRFETDPDWCGNCGDCDQCNPNDSALRIPHSALDTEEFFYARGAF